MHCPVLQRMLKLQGWTGEAQGRDEAHFGCLWPVVFSVFCKSVIWMHQNSELPEADVMRIREEIALELALSLIQTQTLGAVPMQFTFQFESMIHVCYEMLAIDMYRLSSRVEFCSGSHARLACPMQ